MFIFARKTFKSYITPKRQQVRSNSPTWNDKVIRKFVLYLNTFQLLSTERSEKASRFSSRKPANSLFIASKFVLLHVVKKMLFWLCWKHRLEYTSWTAKSSDLIPGKWAIEEARLEPVVSIKSNILAVVLKVWVGSVTICAKEISVKKLGRSW